MTFKRGQSGNPKGRPRGAIGKRAQFSQFLESYSNQLVEKVIELALTGDVNALRICIERIVPKTNREAIDIEIPEKLDKETSRDISRKILKAIVDGKLSVDEGDKLIRLINNRCREFEFENTDSLLARVTDPIEAAKIYQQVMSGK